MADLSKLKRGEDNMVSTRKGKGRYLPNIYWKAGDDEPKFLAFLTPLQEVPRLLMHGFVRTANGPRTFVCRKNEIFEDENPTEECQVCDDFKNAKGESKYPPRNQWLALAVELEPVTERVNGRQKITGFNVVMDEWEYEKDGKTEKGTAPHVGIVSQALKNFWTPFSAKVNREITRNGVGDLNEIVYEVSRVGKTKDDTTYLFEPYAPELRPDLSEFDFPSLEDWIETKGSAKYYEEELSDGVAEEDGDDTPSEPEKASAASDQEDTSSRFDALKARLEEREQEEEKATA
jgi:hypothetical protein